MKLALWNLPPADLMRAGFESARIPDLDVVRARPEACAALLIEQKVDVALMPTSMALKAADGLDIIPGFALSTWKYPFAKLVLKGGMRDWPDEVLYEKRAVQEKLIARIILHEHYGIEPTFIPVGEDNLAAADSSAGAYLLTGRDAYQERSDNLALDIGREWYELANYPMVWGLLATRKDHLDPDVVKRLVDVARVAEEQRSRLLEAVPAEEDLHEFLQDDVRLRLDDLATASLTELKKYMFYYDAVNEIPTLRFAEVPDEDDGEEENRKPLV